MKKKSTDVVILVEFRVLISPDSPSFWKIASSDETWKSDTLDLALFFFDKAVATSLRTICVKNRNLISFLWKHI